MFAEVVMVLLCIEKVLRQIRFASQKAKAALSCHCGPEAGSSADGAVAAICALREVKVRFELNGTAVTTALIGFDHVVALG